MILIDDRAGSRDLSSVAPLSSISELCRLSSGDICFSGNGPSTRDNPNGTISIGIEVKQISDLISSRQSGRLQGVHGQIESMLSDYDEQWLLTYGVYRCGPAGELQSIRYMRGSSKSVWQSFSFGSGNKSVIPYSFLTSIFISTSDIGFRHHHVSANHDSGLDQIAKFIGALYLKRQKPWTEQCKMFHALNKSGEVTRASLKRHLSGLSDYSDDNLSPLPINPDPDLYQRVKCAASLPGVNYHRAISLAEHFPSVLDMFTADEKELSQVDGIGKVLSSNIVSAIRGSKQSNSKKRISTK